jgi:hypothetical protein
MKGQTDATLQSLRLKYNAALAAHQGCLRELIDASMAWETPPAALVEKEARARLELDRVRDGLLAAMTEAITGHRAGAAPSNQQPADGVEADAPDVAS